MSYEDTALGGTSGLSGLSAFHDDALVRVIKRVGRKHKKYAVVCPHAGKTFCFTKFKKTLMQLPLDECHVLLYDNSRCNEHRARLVELAGTLPSYTLVEDLNQPESIESTANVHRIVERCSAVYQNIYENYLPAKSDYVVNLEDDVLAPKGGFARLQNVMNVYPTVGTVVGNCRDRRVVVTTGKHEPIAVNFLKTSRLGGTSAGPSYAVQAVVEQEFGVEAIGAAHMGLWLSRRECVDAVGMRTEPTREGMPLGHDIQYGLRLNEAGWKFAVDWSVKLEHFYQQDGITLSV